MCVLNHEILFYLYYFFLASFGKKSKYHLCSWNQKYRYLYIQFYQVNKEGKHHIIAGEYNKKDDSDYTCDEFDIWIDKSAPEKATIEVDGTEKNGEYGLGSKVTIIEGTDALSGIANTEISVKDSDENELELDNKRSFTLDRDGTYTITVTCTDNVGNSSTETKIIKISKEFKSNPKDVSGPENKKESVADTIIPNTGTKAFVYLLIIGVFVINIRRVHKKTKKMKF